LRFTGTESYFVSEASVYRLLKSRDLIASPGLYRDQGGRCVQGSRPPPLTSCGKPTSPSEGDWLGLFYLSTVLDDFSHYIVAWKLCTSMRAEDVTDTLDRASRASGLDRPSPPDRPRLPSDAALPLFATFPGP